MPKRFLIDNRLDSYKGFYDAGWATAYMGRIRGSELHQIGVDLCAAWKGMSNARRLPWLMVRVTKESIDGAVMTRTPMPLDALRSVAKRISARATLRGIRLPDDVGRALVEAIQAEERELIEKFDRERSKPENRIQDDYVWSMLINDPDFTLGLWMAEVSAYCGVYFAYEDLLIRSMKRVTRRPSLRTPELSTVLRREMGADVAEKCWSDAGIERARLVRAGAVHNGRRITKDLEKYRTSLRLEEDEIVIFPEETIALHRLLMDRVETVTGALLKHPGLAS